MISDIQASQQVFNAFQESLKVLSSYSGPIPNLSFDKNFCDDKEIDGRCYYPDSIILRPDCPHLTIAHELAHWMTLSAAEEESKRLGKSTTHLRVDIYKIEELKGESEIFSILYDVVKLAQSTPEITRVWETIGISESNIFDHWKVQARVRPEEILANSIAQFIAERHFPADLDFLENIGDGATAMDTDGYWSVPSFEKLKPLISKL
ncbi:hypothetical protein [Xanthomonas campestris]|uniref:hypothetical protein n=1 Tax=Xanthomonas campestris TaxID=339 RepID=UPI001E53F77E|nr:hypothetical protein [Xanthomonas campestris]MCC8685895.1 hypothetical protein [Xanthomonas campestris]MCW1997285.1 hypothetical protein [Xanthomonas campestris]MEA9678984.1 hypothetical protein [Xanthomonas campestris pv. raphani]MEA9698421.1 hypothetical protein [Xanthomonas campestris pv. raphani]MEA9777741.1 hypothetical protein [Xanthomonas campestris pv. raphani]